MTDSLGILNEPWLCSSQGSFFVVKHYSKCVIDY